MPTTLKSFAEVNKIQYFMISFTDLFGCQRAKIVPTQAISEMETSGAGFAGFASWLDMSPADSDMLAIPDSSEVVQLPWKPEVAWVPANCFMDDSSVAQAPRNVLKKVVDRAKTLGFEIKTGVEAEFFLLSEDGTSVSDVFDHAEKPCYDQQIIMRRYDVIAEICDYMLSLGWQPYQNDHEDANGQYEMNWGYDESMRTADKHSFFKFMVKSVAEKHGLRATFMPKPFSHLTGNGCHLHISVWQNGKNLFEDRKSADGLSEVGLNFLAGVLKNAPSMTAITNPTVNSYKRINAPVTKSGATWSPNTVTWTGNNRTHMVRVPDNGRFELRLADGAVNPYLLQAVVAAAGLDGIENKLTPGKKHNINMYEEGHKLKNVKTLPLNLLDALRLLKSNKIIRQYLGEELVDGFLKLKEKEWNDYSNFLSEWERKNTLDI